MGGAARRTDAGGGTINVGDGTQEYGRRRKRRGVGNGYFGFFFQAEDGIRDHCVTGVQTCALPISGLRELVPIDSALIDLPDSRNGAASQRVGVHTGAEAYASVNFMPSFAIMSSTGVL